MKFFFVYENINSFIRSRGMLEALKAHGHTVELSDNIHKLPPSDTDVYLYGIFSKINTQVDLSHIKCKVIILQVDDNESMILSRLSKETINNTHRFLKNNWPIELPEILKDRIGFMPTFINPINPSSGKELIDRNIKIMYYGKSTNPIRQELLNIMTGSDLPFEGGEFIWENIYFDKLKETSVLLAPWGHHQMTYRLYEGLAYRNLVIGQRIDMCSCINADLKSGVHFISVRDDLGDLVEKVRYYLEHISEAQEIANAGYDHYCKYLAPKDGTISEYVYQKCFDSWNL